MSRRAGALACAMALGWASPARAEEVRYRLDNGLRVVLAPDAALEDVTVLVTYDAGEADDPPGKEGLAHVVSHVVSASTRHAPDGEAMRLEARAGAAFGSWTDLDRSQYETTAGPEALRLLLWLERDRMAFRPDALTDTEVTRERAIVEY